MIEQVERIHAELSIKLLGDLEILHHRHVRSERPRAVNRVTADVTYGSACRTSEPRARRWCHRTEVSARRGGDGQSTNWSEERDDVFDGIEGTGANFERAVLVGTAWASIRDLATFAVTWRPGQTATPVRSAIQLPSADDQVHGATSSRAKRMSFAEWKLVNDSRCKHVITVHIVWAIRDAGAVNLIVADVVISVGESVMSYELQASREPLIELDLERVVIAARVVPEEVTQVAGATSQLVHEGHPAIATGPS